MKLTDVGLKTKMTVGGMLPVALIFAIAVIAWWAMNSLREASHMVDNTHRVIEESRNIEKLLVDMETGMYGYLLIGKEDYLEPYETAIKAIHEKFDQLKTRIGTDAKQVELLNEAQELVKKWQKSVGEPLIALRRQVGEAKDMNHLAILVRQGRGKKYSEQFRTLTDDFIAEERSSLTRRETQAEKESDPDKLREIMIWVTNANRVVVRAQDILIAGTDMETGLMGYLLTGDEEYLPIFERGKKRLFELIDEQKMSEVHSVEQLQRLVDMEAIIQAWLKKDVEPLMELRKQIGQSKGMLDVSNAVADSQGKRITDVFRGVMLAFVDEEETRLKEQDEMVDQTQRRASRFMLAASVAVMVAAFLISFFLAGRITRPMIEAMGLAESISHGDLTRELRVRESDEVGRLGTALNTMVETVRGQIKRTLEGVNVLAATAAEISATVAELSASTSKTTAAVTETSTTVEQVKQAARVSGEKAKAVAEVANRALKISEDGKKATQDTIHRMNVIKEQMETIGETVVKLNDHSRAIEEIVAAVQDLADQSNLLAVNASIEAARAGDQGRGFAVVAQEIKSLADQSRTARQQIRTILDENRKWVSAVVMATEQGGKAVEAGVNQSVLAGDSIRGLVSSVEESSRSAGVIDATSEQQYIGVDQVAKAMANIEQAMQQNLAGSVQLESAARRLEDLGAQLREMVAVYQV